MKTLLPVLLWLAGVASAAEPPVQHGFGSIVEVTAMPDGRYHYDGRAMSERDLRGLLEELDRQLHIDRIDLRAADGAVPAAQREAVARMAATLHAAMFVEHDGKLLPVDAAPPAP